MLSYSITIRTLGTAGEKFRLELQSIKKQTIQPDKIRVYIAEGHPRPDFQIGKEEYVWVKKGMMGQRILPYEDIESDLLFFLDDDVQLSPDSVEKMIDALVANNLDAIGADVFQNHKMSVGLKFYSAFVNLVTPHLSQKWAFKIKNDGAFSYNNSPKNDCILSQSCAGPAWMIKKSVYDKLNLKDELWLEKLGYSYGEDQLLTYKIFRNGFRLGVLYNCGILNLDGQTDSNRYKNDPERIFIKTKANFAIWWRTIFSTPGSKSKKVRETLSFGFKTFWSLFPVIIFSLKSLSISPFIQFFKGNVDAWKFVHNSEFISLPSYVIPKT